MRTISLALFVLLSSACSSRTYNRLTAVASVAIIAADWCQTRGMARTEWADGRWEGGWPTGHVIGPKPDTVSVDLWFAFATALYLSVAQAIPEKYRGLLYTGAVITQGYNLSVISTGISEGLHGCPVL